MFLMEYVRDDKGHPRGMVVAVGAGNVGWSKCHKTDQFNKDLAYRIAYGRAMKGFNREIPSDVRPYFVKMWDRSMRYYK